MSFDFTGKKYLVTGAGRSIGRELTKAIVKAGGEVYALGRTKENLESLAREIKNVHPVVADLNDWEATRKVLDELEALDGVVNNAVAALSFANPLDVTKEAIAKDVEVDLMAPINVIQVTAKKMIEAGKPGSIVNVSGLAGLNAMKALRGYLGLSISKAGLNMVTKQFALELGPHKIRVNSVCPTFVKTDMMTQMLDNAPELKERLTSMTPQGRACEVNEVVGPILYLLSDHSSMVTGTLHTVDGGLTCQIPV